jgi:mono/diheme cytochrome c family protein
MRWCSSRVIVAFGLVAAACGAGHASVTADGRALFVQACGTCHTVSGTNSPSHQGGDLLAVRVSRPVMVQFEREMPVRRRLTSGELDSIAEYILGLQRRAG